MSVTTSTTEYVIDAATRSILPNAALWPLQRRQLYLIRQDVDVPYSIDERVLPCGDAAVQPSQTVVLVVTVVIDASPLSLLQTEGKIRNQPLDATRHRLFGYDVCDDARLSIVMNIHFSDANLEDRRQAIRHQLNGYHLFDTCEAAESFSRSVTTCFPEHAPYNLVGLYTQTDT